MRALDDETQAAMYAMVREEIPRRGYPMYEISNYAPAGHEARHNLTYWRSENWLGIGAGAHSWAQFAGSVDDREHRWGRRWWDERMMDWTMHDEAVKVQLFRFIDALPQLLGGTSETSAIPGGLLALS